MNKIIIQRLLLATLIVGISGDALAQAKGAKGPKPSPAAKLTEEEMKLADPNTLLPMPGEILAVLGASGSDYWKKAAAELKGAPDAKIDDPTARAVALGTSVADAFLAIQAQDPELLSKLSVRVLSLAESLGASDPILSRGKNISEQASKGQWLLLFPLLDDVYQATVKEIERLGDQDSATIALAAGWLRGTELFANALNASYDEGSSRALRQGALVEHLQSRMDKLSDATKGTPEAKAINNALKELKPLVSIDQKSAVAKEKAAEIAQAASAGLRRN